MYSEAKKAMYINLEASLIFWTKLSKSLEKIVYLRNKYNWCVMNNIIKGKQWTIIWHINNMKMSHIDSDVVSGVISDIDTEYVNITNMNITRGTIQKYLGMTID